MKLRSFANSLGISYSTALRMFRKGHVPGAFKLPSGTIYVPDDAIDRIRSENVQDMNTFISDLTGMLSSSLDKASLAIVLEKIELCLSCDKDGKS